MSHPKPKLFPSPISMPHWFIVLLAFAAAAYAGATPDLSGSSYPHGDSSMDSSARMPPLAQSKPISTSTVAQVPAAPASPMPLPQGALIPLQAVAGLGMGFLGVVVGAGIGSRVESCSYGESYCGLGGFLFGGVLGLAVASPLGVYIMGQAAHHDGSYLLTAFGSFVGLLATVPIVQETYIGNSVAGSFAVVLGLPVVGGLLTYRLSDRLALSVSPEPELSLAGRQAPPPLTSKDFRADIRVVLLRL